MEISGLQGNWSWHSPLQLPLQVYGFPWLNEEGVYRRLPLNIHGLSEAIDQLANLTAGGQIRFKSNTNRLAIRVMAGAYAQMDHMTATGQSGFDVYIGEVGQERYVGTSRIKWDGQCYEALMFDGENMDTNQTITINFPLYQQVLEVAVGLPPHASIERDDSLEHRGRLICYGTSITQGACASRPGLAYTQQLGRMLSREVINLGFSGNGRGEAQIAEIIGTIEHVDAIIIDYEANCTTERYRETLETFLAICRRHHPSVPVLVVSRIVYAKEFIIPSERTDRRQRRTFARKMVMKLNHEGDDRLFFIDGEKLLGSRFDECTVDGVHPNDLGFSRIAKGIYNKLRKIIEDSSVTLKSNRAIHTSDKYL
ncbi:SGNH/GDSL hydrolase family protein [Paenibacillus sp. strain BS8-2]